MKKRVWLKQLRISRGLTQDTVATRAFIDRGFYAQIENGTRDPSLLVAGRIADALGIRPQIFFMEHLNQGSSIFEKSYTIFAHCDSQLRYSWIWHPCTSLDSYIGKQDGEIGHNEGLSELTYLKKQVLLQGVALEKVILFPSHGELVPFLVRGEPLINEDERIEGISLMLTCMPGLLSSIQALKAAEPRGVFQGHVLYSFDREDKYLNRLYEYATEGIRYGYDVWIIESTEIYRQLICKLLDDHVVSELNAIHFVDYEIAYGPRHELDASRFCAYFSARLNYVLEHGIPTRTWTRVRCEQPRDADITKLNECESSISDIFPNTGIVSVCAYDGNKTSAALQTALLRSHEYFMTDEELVYSPLYSENKYTDILPALSKLSRNQNE